MAVSADYGKLMKEIRKQYNLSQEELAEKCNYSSKSIVSRCENGKNVLSNKNIDKLKTTFPSYFEEATDENGLYEYNLIIKSGILALKRSKLLNKESITFTDIDDVTNFFNDVYDLFELAEEHLYMLCLNNAKIGVAVFLLGKGTETYAFCSKKYILSRMLLTGAMSFILVHNHPSGLPEPSSADISLAKNVKKHCEDLDIKMDDSIVIAGTKSASLKHLIE